MDDQRPGPAIARRSGGGSIDGATAVEMDKDDWKELGGTGLQSARLVVAVNPGDLNLGWGGGGYLPISPYP